MNRNTSFMAKIGEQDKPVAVITQVCDANGKVKTRVLNGSHIRA